MVRKDGAEAKKERLESIAKKIMSALSQELEISLSKTIAVIEYEYGLSKEKALEYLETLEKLNRFVLDKDADKIKKMNAG